MGDRANFGIKQHDGHIMFVYGHWAGYQMFNRLAHALKSVADNARFDDEAYANRLIISSLIGDSGPLGWGVTVDWICDNEHSIPVVNLEDRTVTLHAYAGNVLGEPKFTMPADKFINKYLK